MLDIHEHWKNRAQWYNIQVSSTGKSYKLDHDSIGCTLTKTGVIKLPAGMSIINIESCVCTKRKSDQGINIVYLDENTQGFTLPDKSALSSADIWVNVRRCD